MILWWVLAAPSPVAGIDLTWLQSAVVGTVAAALVGGLFATAQMLGNKKLKSPADQLAEVEFYVRLAKQQVDEAKADKAAIQANLEASRLYVEKLEGDGRTDFETIRGLNQSINRLEARIARKDEIIRTKQATIDRVAAKLARGEAITLADLGADLSPTAESSDEDDPLTTDTGPTLVH